ncbi:MAG TPA: AbrB/MazE/SpoVT family DNA-binding domain-containing protein [Opitutales bacterium]|nr:AbrB/MazE/SpoVT family DNA-binding domain-containing protein [Opitutales bacterium]
MKITIDRAGRLVVPKRLREQFHFSAGTTIELTAEPDGLRLRLPKTSSCLVEKDGVLVQQVEGVSAIDSTAFINQQRDLRSLQTMPSEETD